MDRFVWLCPWALSMNVDPRCISEPFGVRLGVRQMTSWCKMWIFLRGIFWICGRQSSSRKTRMIPWGTFICARAVMRSKSQRCIAVDVWVTVAWRAGCIFIDPIRARWWIKEKWIQPNPSQPLWSNPSMNFPTHINAQTRTMKWSSIPDG